MDGETLTLHAEEIEPPLNSFPLPFQRTEAGAMYVTAPTGVSDETLAEVLSDLTIDEPRTEAPAPALYPPGGESEQGTGKPDLDPGTTSTEKDEPDGGGPLPEADDTEKEFSGTGEEMIEMPTDQELIEDDADREPASEVEQDEPVEAAETTE